MLAPRAFVPIDPHFPMFQALFHEQQIIISNSHGLPIQKVSHGLGKLTVTSSSDHLSDRLNWRAALGAGTMTACSIVRSTMQGIGTGRRDSVIRSSARRCHSVSTGFVIFSPADHKHSFLAIPRSSKGRESIWRSAKSPRGHRSQSPATRLRTPAGGHALTQPHANAERCLGVRWGSTAIDKVEKERVILGRGAFLEAGAGALCKRRILLPNPMVPRGHHSGSDAEGPWRTGGQLFMIQ
jgi:hypothetical protein